MNILLAGQKSFGAAVYDMISAEGHEIVGVWSPGEIGQDSRQDRLTRKAWLAGVWINHTMRTPQWIREQGVDLIVAAHSHDFIGRESRGASRVGGIGYHPSLLPRHRGRDAVRWTIHMGDAIAGGTVYWLTDNVDGGPIAAQDFCHVRPGWGPGDLWREELFPMGVDLLRLTIRDVDAGRLVEIPQDEAVATWEPSWDRPPLFRPELPQLGHRNGFHHVTTREALREAIK